nr:TetR/AcrR family transcriptional regulator [uncultured Shinella sp.]
MTGGSIHPSPKLARDPSGTIKRIIAAARDEFGANGFDGAKVEHIARRAGVSKQLVYLYFNGKDELYSELLKVMTRAAYEGLLKVDFSTMAPELAIRSYIETVFNQFLADPVMAVVTLDQSLHGGAQIRLAPDTKRMREALRQRLQIALDGGREAGVFGAHVGTEELEFMTTIIVSGCVSSRGMFARFLGRRAPEDEDPAVYRDYAVNFILRALRD